MARRTNIVAFAFAAAMSIEPHRASLAQEQSPLTNPESVIRRAQVRIETDISSMNLRTGATGPRSFARGTTVTCDYLDKKLGGASPKFACRLPDGDELKVKYGGTNGEVYAEVAASRLLWALGFGADHMYSVRVVCRGCPDHIGGILRRNGDRVVDPAAVERKIAGEEILDRWDWKDLELVDTAAGGASSPERDAFKLLAVLLQHSDSKPTNQRVVCLDGTGQMDGCRMPLIMIQDLGVTFGRANALNQQPGASMNLERWRQVPVWKNASGCVGNLSGSWTGTLEDPVISDEGRQLLADLLTELTDQQIKDMFDAARVHLRGRAPETGLGGFSTVNEWVATFKQKRREIVERNCAT